MRLKTIEIDGKRYPWRNILKMRREQSKRTAQQTLFELRDDSRPASQQTASGRYEEPLLFEK